MLPYWIIEDCTQEIHRLDHRHQAARDPQGGVIRRWRRRLQSVRRPASRRREAPVTRNEEVVEPDALG